MSRRSRTQRQRAAARRNAASDGAPTQRAAAPKATAREKRGGGVDAIELYRSMAAPSVFMRCLLMVGLVLYIAADTATIASTKSTDTAAGLALFGLVAIMVFLGAGFVRHQRALFRIRRDHPGAWPTSIRFAMSTLPIPLGFGGPAATPRERTLRRITLLLLLAFAVAAVASSSHR